MSVFVVPAQVRGSGMEFVKNWELQFSGTELLALETLWFGHTGYKSTSQEMSFFATILNDYFLLNVDQRSGWSPGMLVPDLGFHLHWWTWYELGKWGFRMCWGIAVDAVCARTAYHCHRRVSFVTLQQLLHALSAGSAMEQLGGDISIPSRIFRTSKASDKLQRMPFEVAKSVCWLMKIYVPLQECVGKCCWWDWLSALPVAGTEAASFVQKPCKLYFCLVKTGACSTQDRSPGQLWRWKSALLRSCFIPRNALFICSSSRSHTSFMQAKPDDKSPSHGRKKGFTGATNCCKNMSFWKLCQDKSKAGHVPAPWLVFGVSLCLLCQGMSPWVFIPDYKYP